MYDKRKIQIIRQLPDVADAGVALAIGNFDGLHRGHRGVIDTMLADARSQHLVPSVLTFEPHPRRYFQPEAPAFLLESLSQKLHRLREWGVQRVYMPRFDARFAALSAEVFLSQVLQQSIGARTVVTGDNFAFGKGRAGSTATLQAWGAAHGIRIHTVGAVMHQDVVCSSSAVRRALQSGDVTQAAALLGRAYTMRGFVRHGDARGRTLGFPTANLDVPEGYCLPAYGVYAVHVHHTSSPEGGALHGVANLGMRPSIGQQPRPTLEVHLFDYDDDLYGARLIVTLIEQIRAEKKFDTLDALRAQITADCALARQRLQQCAEGMK